MKTYQSLTASNPPPRPTEPMKKPTKKNRTSLPDNQPQPAPMKAIYDRDSHDKPVAIIPCATAKQAKALADFCNLPGEQRKELVLTNPDRLGFMYE